MPTPIQPHIKTHGHSFDSRILHLANKLAKMRFFDRILTQFGYQAHWAYKK